MHQAGDMSETFTGVAENELPLQRLYRWERERANHVFLTQPFGGGNVREWTWSQAAYEVRRVAGYLKAQNWEPGSRVAILSKNCAWWVMSDLAIWMAGHVTVPVYPSLKPSTVRQILEHSDSRGCFLGATDDKEAATLGIPPGVASIRFPTAQASGGPAWDTVVAESPAIAGNPTRTADDVATIFYTSGTTGTPKGVVHRFAGFRHLTNALFQRLGLSGEYRVISYLPLAHILERGGLELPAILLGWHLLFTEGPETFLTDLRRARTNLFYSVPRLLTKFQQGVFEKLPKHRLDRLLRVPLLNRVIRKRILQQLGLDRARYAFCGGAPLPPEVLEWYRNLGLDLLEGYGLTEAMITHLPRPGHIRPGYIGIALDGVESRRAENGELLLKSPMNMLGYYKDPSGTRDAFTEDGFLRTGDLVEIEADGQVKIIGRLKEQFKTSKGKYVAPAPIEAKLVTHSEIESCCLMGAGMASPFAVVVLSPEARQRCTDPAMRKALEESLRERLDQVNGELDPHERVMFVAIVSECWTIANGLLTPTLKFRRASIEQRYLACVDDWKRQNRQVVWEEIEEKAKLAGGAQAG
jgi:long-chain acyl-CoA synthetase